MNVIEWNAHEKLSSSFLFAYGFLFGSLSGRQRLVGNDNSRSDHALNREPLRAVTINHLERWPLYRDTLIIERDTTNIYNRTELIRSWYPPGIFQIDYSPAQRVVLRVGRLFKKSNAIIVDWHLSPRNERKELNATESQLRILISHGFISIMLSKQNGCVYTNFMFAV